MVSNNDEKFILYGGPDPDNIGDGCRSIGEFLLKQLLRNGDKVALIDGVTGQPTTYLQLRSQAIRLARVFQTKGVRKNDVIGIVTENRIEFPVTLIAAFLCGAKVAPFNRTYSEREFHHAFNLSKPKIIFTSLYAADKVDEVGRLNTSFLQQVILYGDENPLRSNVTLYSDFLATVPEATKYDSFYCEPLDVAKHVALVLCSSGTTGLPKGVQLTQYNLMVCAAHFLSSPLRDEIPYDELRILGLLPWFHSYGCMSLINMLSVAIQIVHIPKFEEVLFLSCIEKYRINCIFMVPPLMVFLAKSPLVLQYNLTSLRMLHSGAAPLSKEVEDAVKARLPNLDSIRQGYGMSETTLGVLSQSASGKLKPGSVGSVVRGIRVKVVNPETGKILGPNQRGELCFKGTQIMMGYIGDGKETSQVFDSDGYLHTGDVGYYDDDQQFFIVDRLKELIKYNGYQVPPAELEGVILENSKVKDAAVIGMPDERAGELPMAFIVKQDGVQLTAQEVIDYVSKRSSPAKRLHGGVRFIDAIPKNPSGKILRKDLRALLKESKAKL